MTKTKIGLHLNAYILSGIDKLDAGYYEITAWPTYLDNMGQIINEIDISVFEDKYLKKIEGIHGAALSRGVNLMNEKRNEQNKAAIEIAIYIADYVNADYIVFHSGCIEDKAERFCSLENIYSLMKQYDDSRIHLENIPCIGLVNGSVCPVRTVDEWIQFKEQTEKEILLDIPHASMTSHFLKEKIVPYITQLIDELDIKKLHVSDSTAFSKDTHSNIGEGCLPLEDILRGIDSCAEHITLEVKNVRFSDVFLVKQYIK